MAKSRNLNGLPGNLALSYLSALGYYHCGYMSDWINYVARKHNLKEVEIDILNQKVRPEIAEIKPLIYGLKKLNLIISTKLEENDFEQNFIKKAIMNFKIPIDSPKFKNTIYCFPFLEDENGKEYKPKKRLIASVYQADFNPKRIL
jgi:hypothetical protein